MQCCTILRAFKKGCLLKMGCYSENNSDNFRDLCWPNYLSVTVLLIKLKLQNADSLFECPFRFSKDRYSLFQCEGTRGVHSIIKHRPTSRACLVSTLVRAEGWHSGGILSLSYAAGAWLLGSRYPRTTADTSHLTARGWADNSAHGDTARADDALTAATTPVTPQLLGPVHSDANTRHWLRCGAWTRRSWGAPHVPVSVWVSSVPPPPPPLSTLSWSRQFGAHLKFYDICYSAPYLPICTPIKLSFGDVGVNLSCCCVRVTARWPVLLLPHKLWTV